MKTILAKVEDNCQEKQQKVWILWKLPSTKAMHNIKENMWQLWKRKLLQMFLQEDTNIEKTPGAEK